MSTMTMKDMHSSLEPRCWSILQPKEAQYRCLRKIKLRILYSWDALLIFSILYLLHYSNASSDDRFTCAGLHTAGVTIPPGDITIEAGSPLEIFCVLDPTHSDAAGKNASDLVFYRNSEEVLSPFVKIVNSTTIRLFVNKTVPMISSYYCKLRDRGNHSINIPVCLNQVTIGYKPQEVEDFTCISRNWESLNCTWTPPHNYIKTEYTLRFRLPGRSGGRFIYSCPNNTMTNDSCYWDLKTSPLYRQPYEYLYFYIQGSNVLGTVKFPVLKFHHFAHVIPSPPKDLKVVNKTAHSIYLYWTVHLPLQTFPPGLKHRVEYNSKWDRRDQWHVANSSLIQVHGKQQYYLNLTGLKYAHTPYDIRVYMKSAAAVGDDKWSDPATLVNRTEPTLPDRPPKTDIGSFEVTGGSTSRTVFIYWQQIPDYLHNGDNFRYKFIGVKENGFSSSVIPSELTKTYAKFKDLSNNSYEFTIVSSNDVGDSKEHSVVRVPNNYERPAEPMTFTKIAFGNGTYELSWQGTSSNRHNNNIQNYTIFWCQNNRDRPYQCTGYLNWTYVPANVHIMNITLPEIDVGLYQFAVSANSRTASSGMVWASCTVIHDQVIGQMKDVWFNKKNTQPTIVEVAWKLECSNRVGSIRGFRIYYCPTKAPQDRNCKESELNKTVEFKKISTQMSTIISGLKPYTTYRFSVSVLSNRQEGPRSEPVLETTFETAPDPPPNVVISNITNSSAVVSWLQPVQLNGHLRYFEVFYNGLKKRVEKDKFSNSSSYYVKLSNLESFATYNVTVQACTVACSNDSSMESLKTLEGFPSQMEPPIFDFVNSSQMRVFWKEPLKPNGLLDYFDLMVEQTGGENNISREYNVTGLELQVPISDCQNGGSLHTYWFSVRAVNLGSNNQTYKGPWSEKRKGGCYAPGQPSYLQAITWAFAITAVVIVFFGFACLARRCWKVYKQMDEVDVVLPPGLVIEVPMKTFPDGYDQQGCNGGQNHMPSERCDKSSDQELLLKKKDEHHGRNPSGDSSGCSSAHESVSSSSSPGTDVSSDSGTEVDQRPPSPDGVFMENQWVQPPPLSSPLYSGPETSEILEDDGTLSKDDPYVGIERSLSVKERLGSVKEGSLRSSNAYSTPNLADASDSSRNGYSCLGTWPSASYIKMPSNEEEGATETNVPAPLYSKVGSQIMNGEIPISPQNGYCIVGLPQDDPKPEVPIPKLKPATFGMKPKNKPARGYVSLARMNGQPVFIPTTKSPTQATTPSPGPSSAQRGYVTLPPLGQSMRESPVSSGKNCIMSMQPIDDGGGKDPPLLTVDGEVESRGGGEGGSGTPDSYCRVGWNPSPTPVIPVKLSSNEAVVGASEGKSVLKSGGEREDPSKKAEGYVTVSKLPEQVQEVAKPVSSKPGSGYVMVPDKWANGTVLTAKNSLSPPRSPMLQDQDWLGDFNSKDAPKEHSVSGKEQNGGYVPHRQFEKKVAPTVTPKTFHVQSEEPYTKVFTVSPDSKAKSPSMMV